MVNVKLPSHIVITGVLLTFLSCRHSPQVILPPDVELKPGDLVFRLGAGLTSKAITTYDCNGHYSHVGMVVDSAGYPMIIHAVPDEHDSPSDFDRVRMDAPDVFFDSFRALCGAVCRPINQDVVHQVTSYAWQAYYRQAAFDHAYDMSDTTNLYCCELVIRAFIHAGASLTLPPQHHVNAHWFNIDSCYFPSDIYMAPELKPLYIF